MCRADDYESKEYADMKAQKVTMMKNESKYVVGSWRIILVGVVCFVAGMIVGK